MAKSIVARRKGDEYQARFFWLKLLELRTDDYVESVTFESDQIPFVDDIVVSYCEPKIDRQTGKRIVRDLFQCKYHMTQRDAFTHEKLINPRFINRKTSMLKCLYDAYLKLSEELDPDTFRLYIVSNWYWDYRDPLAEHLHEEMIRPTFYEKGTRSTRHVVRSNWFRHLSISLEELRVFLDTVRFMLGENLSALTTRLEQHLKFAELQPIDPTRTNVIYDDLAWKLFGQGRNSFDKNSFDQMIREEKLVISRSTEHSEISIQSFAQFARRSHDLQATHLDLCEFFDERFPKDDSCWKQEIPERITTFMLNEDLSSLPQPIHLFFDCHLSIAFLAGHLISPKHRIQIIPTQKEGIDYVLWAQNVLDTNDDLWQFNAVGEINKELILGISVTHQIQTDLQPYLETENLNDLPQVLVCPTGGADPRAVCDAHHAWQLGYQLAKRLRGMLPHTCHTIHLFFAGPVALGYIFGHTLRHITPQIQLYEHDFEGQRGGQRYYPSLCIPYQS